MRLLKNIKYKNNVWNVYLIKYEKIKSYEKINCERKETRNFTLEVKIIYFDL